MTCQECELALAMDGESTGAVTRHLAECSSCAELLVTLRANTEALRLMFGVSRARRVEKIVAPPQPWMRIATVIPASSPPVKRHAHRRPRAKEKMEPLKVKMFTSDPNVVIYWLINPKEGTE
jgi:hypothetical protein